MSDSARTAAEEPNPDTVGPMNALANTARTLRCAVLLGLLGVGVVAQDWVPRKMLPRSMGPDTRLRVVEEGEFDTRLEAKLDGRRLEVSVPLKPLVTASKVEGGFLLAGLSPSGEGQIVAVETQGDELVQLPPVLTTGSAVPFAVGMGSGLIVVWLADGRIVAAEQAGLGDLPAWSTFQLVGSRPVHRGMFAERAAIQVVDRVRIRVSAGPGSALITFVQESEIWAEEGMPAVHRVPMLEVRSPVRVGQRNEFRARVHGPILLEEEGSDHRDPLPDAAPDARWLAFPAGLSDSLRADRRYRLIASGEQSAWFFPVMVRGTAWASEGAQIGAIRTHESGVRLESGSCTLHSRITLSEPPDQELSTVCLLSRSSAPLPTVVVREGRTWLVPEAVATLTQATKPQAKSYALATMVPLSRELMAAGTWMHVQIVARNAQGVVLGATEVRSVPVLPDVGSLWAEHEQRRRESADRLWAQHSVANVQQFWEQLIQ